MKICPSCNNLNPDDVASCMRCGCALEGGAPQGAAAAPPPLNGPISSPDYGMPAATFEVGTFVGSGRYEILIPLGTGAMGSVYKARDTRLDREVALKALSGALLSHPTARERMGREARALARIEHRNVVQIRDVFDEGPVLVLVLELVTGGDLAERARSAALDQGEVMALMEGVLTGLEAIHDVGIIHRDIKPSNVLLTEAGIPKLTDLGIAHDSRGRAMTGMGAQLGTAEYMAPEQVRGQAVDERTDIYAAGVMLYELLAHRVPFTGESDFDICHAHVHEAPNLKPLENNVSEHLLEVCRKALEKAPADRWQCARDMREALHDEGLELSIVSLPSSPVPSAPAASVPAPAPPVPAPAPVFVAKQVVAHPTPTDEVAAAASSRTWFGGREPRGTFFLQLIALLVGWVIYTAIIESTSSDGGAALTFLIIGLPLLIYQFGLLGRRFHDMGRSAWWLLTLVIPIVNWAVGLYMLFAPSNPDQNEWGPSPDAKVN